MQKIIEHSYIEMPNGAITKHVCIMGQSGSGKSQLLASLIQQALQKTVLDRDEVTRIPESVARHYLD